MKDIENLPSTPEENENMDEFEETPLADSPLEEFAPIAAIEEQPASPLYAQPSDELPLEEEVSEEVTVEKEESKVRLVFRKLIRWTAGLLIIFGLGLITGLYALYLPATRDVQQGNADLEAARGQIETLETQKSELEAHNAYLQSLEDKNNELLAQQKAFNLHVVILDARVDVANAILALAQEDGAQARIILNKTSKTLDAISDLLASDQKDAVASMRQRLELVMGEMENDPYAAQSDLDVLATNLLQLEDSLFTE